MADRVDLDKLQRLAEASADTWHETSQERGVSWWKAENLREYFDGEEADAEFIAAAEPTLILSLIAELRSHRDHELAGGWVEGAPTAAGGYWVVMWLKNPDRWEVRLVDISPAVLNPGGRLLLKMANGAAFVYEPNRYAISHHMPVVQPVAPVSLDRPAPPKPTPEPPEETL